MMDLALFARIEYEQLVEMQKTSGIRNGVRWNGSTRAILGFCFGWPTVDPTSSSATKYLTKQLGVRRANTPGINPHSECRGTTPIRNGRRAPAVGLLSDECCGSYPKAKAILLRELDPRWWFEKRNLDEPWRGGVR